MSREADSARRFGNYEILGLLGRGGMAEVYRARVLSGPREGWTVALKRLVPALAQDPAAVEMFANEADLSKWLEHPNIVKVLEVGVIREVYYMVMELVDGRDIGQILRRCRVRGILWPIDFAVYAARILLEALAYAHQAKGPSGASLGIVHCDVSPSNLFVSRTGDLKLGDFGVARARSTLSTGEELLGKPYYLSPERLEGEITPAADLWAATVTLYEMLTLERPFCGKTEEEVYAAIRRGRYLPVRSIRPEVPAPLGALVDRNFGRKPPDRFQTAEEYAQALSPLFDERVGTPLAISAMVRGLFGTED